MALVCSALDTRAASTSGFEPHEAHEIVVEKDGFRPSQWVDMLAAEPDGHGGFCYRADLFARYVDGQMALVVRSELLARDPARFRHMIDFAHSNALNIHVDPGLASLDAGAWAALQARR